MNQTHYIRNGTELIYIANVLIQFVKKQAQRCIEAL